MGKFYLLPVSLMLLSPCFANDIESGQTSYEYKILTQKEINASIAVDPKLLKDLEEDISLLAQKKNRKSSDLIQEPQKSENAEKNNPSSNQTKDPQAQHKEIRKRPTSREERLLSQKKRKFSERVASRKKSTQASRQDKRHSAREKQQSNTAKSGQTVKPIPKNSQNAAESLKAPQKSAAKKTVPQQGETPKQLPKFSQQEQAALQPPKAPPNLDEVKKDLSEKESNELRTPKSKRPATQATEKVREEKKRLAAKKKQKLAEITDEPLKGRAKSQTNEKEASGSTAFQKQLNSEESSSTYDRYIRRQNHHTMPKDSPQNNSATEENVGSKSNSRAVSKTPEQKKIESEELAPAESAQVETIQKKKKKITKAESSPLDESAQKEPDQKQLDFTENLQAQRENIDSEQFESKELSQAESQKLPDAHPSSPQKCQTPFHMAHVGLRHTEARGVGYSDGYTTLEGFAIYNRTSSFMPFIDLRGHVFDNGKFAGNVGLGGRSLLSSIDHVLGCYLYYDVRQDKHHLTAQQLGPGIELLGKRMEYRVNGYFPISDRKSHKYNFDFGRFEGHHILLKAKQRQVMSGGDAEVGAHLTQSTKYDAYAGIGPYYFSSSNASSWGGKARLLGRFKEYVSLEVSYSYDHLFKSVVQGTIAVNLPFGKKLRRKGNDCSSQINLALSRAAFSPYRFEIPVIKKVSRKPTAINPVTGNPWKVWFVNNTSSSNGTFESPFPTLVQAQNASGPNDMIYVFPGDGTTKGMDMGIALKNGQTFFGSGIAHEIKTTNGAIKIPVFSQTSPSITNLNPAINFGGNLIVPANGNEISGFNLIMNLSASAIFNPAPIQGIIVKHNNFTGSINYNGVIVTGSGKMIITNNQFAGDGFPGQAIRLTTSNGGEITGKASDNTISNFFEGIGMNLANDSSANFTISNNTISQIGNLSIFWGATAGIPLLSNALISGNSISSFRDVGVLVQIGVGPNSTIRIIDNAINNNTGEIASNGIAFSMSQGPNEGRVVISDNRVFTSTLPTLTSGILVEIVPTSGTSFSADIANNQVTTGTGAGSAGINVRTGSNGIICSSITDNQVTQQVPSGTNDFSITTSGSGIINIDNFSGNTGPNILISGNVNFVPGGTCGN